MYTQVSEPTTEKEVVLEGLKVTSGVCFVILDLFELEDAWHGGLVLKRRKSVLREPRP